MKTTLFTAILLAMGLLACTDTTDDVSGSTNRAKGKVVSVGNGQAYVWADLDAQSNPSAIGITMTKGALDNLPATMPGTSFDLELPKELAGKTPFDHVSMDYNPHGHEPDAIYTLPHFDFHFYTMPLADRKAIPPYTAATAAKFDNLPPSGIMPASYIRLPGGVPGMGVHWADPNAPELKGTKFTETFIYGSYDGSLTFYEPMITVEYLKSTPNLTKNIPQPTRFAKSSYYPMRYRIAQEGADVVVALEGMMKM